MEGGELDNVSKKAQYAWWEVPIEGVVGVGVGNVEFLEWLVGSCLNRAEVAFVEATRQPHHNSHNACSHDPVQRGLFVGVPRVLQSTCRCSPHIPLLLIKTVMGNCYR